MPDIGWTSAADADTFFTTRYGAGAWAAIVALDKTALLTTAWDRIRFDPTWAVPATPSAAEKLLLAHAQYVTAWYMYNHLEDEDRRKGMQAQGVIQAGIVKETYDPSLLNEIPLPGEAIKILIDNFKTAKSFYALDIDRKEPVGADQNVVEIDDSLNVPGIY